MKSRIILIFLGFSFLWVVLGIRAAYLQVWPNEKLARLQKKQFEKIVEVQSRRGAVFDRHGQELAISVPSYSVYADPSIIHHPRSVAKKLASILKVSVEEIYKKLESKERRFVWIQRKLDHTVYEKILALNIWGLGWIEESKRIYPNENFLSQVLGLVGLEGRGLEGIELSYDEALRGQKKMVNVQRDARGRPLLNQGFVLSDIPDGADIYLTIDSEIQYNLEKELQRTLEDYGALSSMGIILDAQTSEIVALAAAPSFNPNRPAHKNPSLRRMKVVTDTYEPGSTMKTFVIAGALREKLLKPNTKYFCENGKMKIGRRIIREADEKHAWGWLSVSQILARSSNIGATKIAFDLGADSLYKTLRDFGFGEKLGVDFPGEAKGLLTTPPWNPHLFSNISFGHGIAVTALQVANAYAAIANGGTLKRPRILKGIKKGDAFSENSEESIRQVLTKEQASQMKLMLTEVTSSPEGTGDRARVNGFIVAGKTGTAQKVNPQGRGYLPNAYISSFVGFVPAHNPKYVIYIVVDEPQKVFYGSSVAAPVFSRMATFAVHKAGLSPIVISQKNIAPTKESRDVFIEKEKRKEIVDSYVDKNIMPNLRDKSLRDVLRKIQGLDLKVKIEGEGYVKQTFPQPGEPVPEDRNIQIWLE